MLVLDVWHPDIKDFIKAKQQPNVLTRFNMSVGITDGFMYAVENDLHWNLEFPPTNHPNYKDEWKGNLKEWKANGHPTTVYEVVKAKDLWDMIMMSTYTRNEPGVLFLDKANELNPLSYCETLYASNPCGEIIMPTGVCNLGNINLVKCLVYNEETNEYQVDYNKIGFLASIGIKFLDMINDLTNVPLDIYRKSINEKRRVGQGVMGLGSIHFMLGIRYGSKESLELMDKIWQTKTIGELVASANLGKTFGDFELFDKEKFFSTKWWNELEIPKEAKDAIERIGHMRNSHRSANAPTGNTAMFAGCVSGGIEPVFAKEYDRWTIVNEHERAKLKLDGFNFPNVPKGEWFETEELKFVIVHKEEVIKGSYNGNDYLIDRTRGLTKKVHIMDYGWSEVLKYRKLHDVRMTHSDDNEIYATTSSLTVSEHMETLAIIAKYTDMNSSKTVNIPNEYTFENFKDLYLDAYRKNIKGATSYRANTMVAVLESTDGNVKFPDEKLPEVDVRILPFPELTKEKMLDIEGGYRRRLIGANGEKFYMELTHRGDKLYELFAVLPKAAGMVDDVFRPKVYFDKLSSWNFICTLISSQLRYGVPINDILSDANATSFSSFDLPGLIGTVLEEFKEIVITKISTKEEGNVSDTTLKGKCPKCKQYEVIQDEGCEKCLNCGWSPCS